MTLLLFHPPFTFSAFIIRKSSHILVVFVPLRLVVICVFVTSRLPSLRGFFGARSSIKFFGASVTEQESQHFAGVRDRKRSMAVHADVKLRIIRHVWHFVRSIETVSASSLNLSNVKPMLHGGPSSPFRAFLQNDTMFRRFVGSDRKCPLNENSNVSISIENHSTHTFSVTAIIIRFEHVVLSFNSFEVFQRFQKI